MGLGIKNFNIMGFHWKLAKLARGLAKKTIYRRDCLERGAWTVHKFKRGFGKKKEGGVFEGGGGWYPNAHYVP